MRNLPKGLRPPFSFTFIYHFCHCFLSLFSYTVFGAALIRCFRISINAFAFTGFEMYYQHSFRAPVLVIISLLLPCTAFPCHLSATFMHLSTLIINAVSFHRFQMYFRRCCLSPFSDVFSALLLFAVLLYILPDNISEQVFVFQKHLPYAYCLRRQNY